MSPCPDAAAAKQPISVYSDQLSCNNANSPICIRPIPSQLQGSGDGTVTMACSCRRDYISNKADRLAIVGDVAGGCSCSVSLMKWKDDGLK